MITTARTLMTAAACALAISAVLIPPSAAARRPSVPTAFAGPYFVPTNGRVGYHMVSNNGFQQAPCVPPEHSHAVDFTFTGDLPPGVTFDRATIAFVGTPRQAGDWGIMFTWKGLSCTTVQGQSGPKDYGDVTGRLTFHIDP